MNKPGIGIVYLNNHQDSSGSIVIVSKIELIDNGYEVTFVNENHAFGIYDLLTFQRYLEPICCL